MSSDAAVCLLCGRPAQIDALYFPIEKIKYNLCQECHDGPDQSLRIEERLANPEHVGTDRCESQNHLAAARRIATQRLTEISELYDRIARMLKTSGDESRCRDCNAAIVWLRHHQSGRASAYNHDGSPHFKTCPKRAELAVGVLLREAT